MDENLIKELGQKIDTMKSESVTKAELLEIMSKVQALETSGVEVKEMKNDVDQIALRILDLETKGATPSETASLKSILESKTDELKALKDNRSGAVNFVLKAVGNMALSTNTTGQIPQAEREAGITRIVRRQPYILSLVNTGSIMSNLWEWVEQKNPEGGAGMTAEGVKKSQADFDLVLASATVKKVTAFIKVTKEMLDDVELMRSEIDQELTELINLKIDEQILSGDGLTVNLTGILTNATTFAAGVFALKVTNPNNADVLRVAINQSNVAQFNPNYIVLHPSDAAAMDLDKGTDGHYALPPFTSLDGRVVSGIPVVVNTGITEGTFLLGDFTKSGVRFKEGITINVGYENDDFTKNFVTILAEARLVHRVKSNHYAAFVKGTFSTAITAITKP
jgi:HK97 family phage major capsid protein